MKKSKFTKSIAGVISVITILTLIGTVGALNGWFGGGGKIPEDTFTRGLVAYWSFDEGSGNTAYDASGNGNHGTIYGAKWTSGKSGGALSFDGVDDYVEITNSPTLQITSDLTIELWVKFNAFNRRLIEKWRWGEFCLIAYGTQTGYLYWNHGNGTDRVNIVLTGSILELGKWYHIVVVRDSKAKTVQAYVNGVGQGPRSYTLDAATSSYNVEIGRSNPEMLNFHNGLIDEVRIYNRALSPEEIRFHYSRGGPVAYWKFDEGQGTKVYDLSGNGNNGTLNLGTSGNTDPSKAWVPGKFGTALSFDGVDDYVEIPSSASLDTTEAITMEAWVKLNPGGADISYDIIRRTSGYEFYVGRDDGRIRIALQSGASWYNYGSISSIARDGKTWYHIVGTWDKSTGKIKLYINGSLDVTRDGITTSLSPSGNFYIGGFSINYSTYGLIDEVRIYNYARTPDEIRLDYNAGYAARFGPATDCNSDPGSCMTKGLVAYWSFDEGSGNIAYDSSGNGNHGTIYGAKWTNGKFGQALSFDGVDDYVDTTAINITGPITITLWVKLNVPVIDKVHTFVNKYPGVNYWMFYTHEIEKSPVIGFVFTNAGWQRTAGYATALTDMKWHFLAAGYDGTKLFLYEDGILKQTKTIGSDTIRTSAHTVKIGGSTVANEWLNGLIDEVRIYNRALSEEEIRYHYNHTLPKGALSPLAMKEDPSLVGYWSFNEGKGTIINDQSGNNNNGTLYLGSSGNTDPSKAWSPGISGTALSFDGVDDRVLVPRSDSLEPSKITIIAWIYPLAYSTTYPRIVDKVATNGGYLLLLNPSPSNTIEFAWRDSSGNQNSLYSTITYSINKWTFLAAVFDGNTGYLYIDGVLNNTKISTITFSPGTANLTIGNNASLTRPFNGLIDEVRIYNRALSEQEILEHYRNSKYYLASHFGPKTNCREDPGSCIDYGLVGYWSFDEGAGTTAYDASGKGNNGTLVNGPKWTNGKFGQALSFDGVDDYVDFGDIDMLEFTGTAPFSVAAWLWLDPAISSSHIISKEGSSATGVQGWQFGWLGSTIRLIRWRDGNPNVCSFTVPTGKWIHVVFTYDGSIIRGYLNGGFQTSLSSTFEIIGTAYPFRIGARPYGGYYYKGLIDEVRIYNRALSEEEIRYLYNRGAPIAHWKFDEGKGNIAYDSSGNGNNGTLINGPTWVQGKFGSALSFDGVDDYVSVPDSTNIRVQKNTLEAWFTLNSYPSVYDHIIAKAARTLTSPDQNPWVVWVDFGTRDSGWITLRYGTRGNGSGWNDVGFRLTTTAEKSPTWLNRWIHVAGTYDGSSLKLYVNGELKAIKSETRTIQYDSSPWYVGADDQNGDGVADYFHNGLIDDVRIYNYARTPEQILQDYNAGLSAHFK
jgi:hypothetical protein